MIEGRGLLNWPGGIDGLPSYGQLLTPQGDRGRVPVEVIVLAISPWAVMTYERRKPDGSHPFGG